MTNCVHTQMDDHRLRDTVFVYKTYKVCLSEDHHQYYQALRKALDQQLLLAKLDTICTALKTLVRDKDCSTMAAEVTAIANEK